MTKFTDCIQEGDRIIYNKDLGCRINMSQFQRVAKRDTNLENRTMSIFKKKQQMTDQELRMWCVEQLRVNTGHSAQCLVEGAERLFNYIKHGKEDED